MRATSREACGSEKLLAAARDKIANHISPAYDLGNSWCYCPGFFPSPQGLSQTTLRCTVMIERSIPVIFS